MRSGSQEYTHLSRRQRRMPSFLVILLLAAPAIRAASNITIDDTHGDPRTGLVPAYAPATGDSGAWHARTADSECDGCLVTPDARRAKNGTWHESTANPNMGYNVSFSFRGTSLYIYCILANQVDSASTNTFLDIFINDEKVNSFQHFKDISTTDYEYDVPVFANATLSTQNERHYVVIANKANSVNNSLIMFDYAVYTVTENVSNPTTTPTPSPKSSHAVAIGIGVAIPIVVLALVGALCWWFLARRRQQKRPASSDPSSNDETLRPLTPPEEIDMRSASPFYSPSAAYLATGDERTRPSFDGRSQATTMGGSTVNENKRAMLAAVDGTSNGTGPIHEKGASLSGRETPLPRPLPSIPGSPSDRSPSAEPPTDASGSTGTWTEAERVRLRSELANLQFEVETLRARDGPPPIYEGTQR